MTGKRTAENSGGSTLATRVTAAAAWMIAFRWLDRLIGVASLAVLARLLLPEDFGIVGYAILVTGLLDLFTGLATDAELIRHPLADRDYFNAAWTMNVLRGLAIGVLMIALIEPAQRFFDESRLGGIMLTLAAVPLLQGLENVGIVEFRKQLNFDREFRFLLVSRILGTIASLAFAFALRTYWALVVGVIVRTAIRVLLSYRVHPFRPAFDLARVPEIFRFSRWMMIQNLASGVNEKLPGFVIGHLWNSSALAFFNMGKEIADLSATEIRAPIRRALYPGLAQIADRHERLGDVLVESTGMLALLTMPIPLGIALVADDLVPLFLGVRWEATVALLQPLCVAAAITALGTNSQLAYMALNRSHLAALSAMIRLLVLLVLLTGIAPAYGLAGIAYALVGLNCAMLIADYAMSPRFLNIDPTRFLAVAWRPVTAAIAMCTAVWLFRAGYPAASDLASHAWSLAWSALLGAAVYAVCVLGLWILCGRPGGAEQRLTALAGRRTRRREHRAAR